MKKLNGTSASKRVAWLRVASVFVAINIAVAEPSIGEPPATQPNEIAALRNRIAELEAEMASLRQLTSRLVLENESIHSRSGTFSASAKFPTPEQIELYKNEVQRETENAAAKLEGREATLAKELRGLHLGRIDLEVVSPVHRDDGWHFPNESSKLAKIKEAEQWRDNSSLLLKNYKAGTYKESVRFRAEQLELGMIGHLYDADIEQVQGDLDALVIITFPKDRLRESAKSHLVWLRGVDVSTKVDKQKIVLNRLFAVTAKKSFETKAGTRTVFVVEPYDLP